MVYRFDESNTRNVEKGHYNILAAFTSRKIIKV